MLKLSSNDKLYSSDVDLLELAQAREIHTTFCFTQDRVLVNKQCQYAAKWYGTDGSRRIVNYVRQINDGELE